jgi:STAS-like domain of unknown function (DUF4325)
MVYSATATVMSPTTTKLINVASDFSQFPAGRYLTDGPHSGEEFRRLLRDLLGRFATVIVDLDGTFGYGSSFLEEAFGGLVRSGFKAAELRKRLQLRTTDKALEQEILSYIGR